MFAIIRTGGKQYKVSPGNVVVVEKIKGSIGDHVKISEVLLVGDGDKTELGAPTVAKTTVSLEILEQKKSAKVIVFKKKRRHNYRRKKGHRQEVTVLRVAEIDFNGKKEKAEALKKQQPKKEVAKKAPEAKEEKKEAVKKAPAKKVETPKKATSTEKAKTKAAPKKAPAKKATATKKETKK